MALCFGLLAAALLLEIATRIFLDNGMNFDLEMWKYAKDIKVKSPDPEIGHEHRPNRKGVYMGVSLSTASLGLRDRETSLHKGKWVGINN